MCDFHLTLITGFVVHGHISRGENQKGVSDISPTLQESQNKNFTIVWSDFVYWFQLFIIKMCTLMDDSTFASRKSSLRAFIWYIYIYIYIHLHFTKNVTYALLVLTPRYVVWEISINSSESVLRSFEKYDSF